MAADNSLSFGPFWVDTQNECIRRGTEVIKLTPKAFAVLRYLVEHPGRLVTKDEIFEAVWKETVVSDITLAVCVREIRKSLGDEAKTPQYIETRHRRGYRFIAALTTAPPVVSSQYPVGSGQEQSANEQEVSSWMSAQAGIQEPKAQASGESPWIPAFAGMTPPPSAPQIHNPSPQLDQTPDPEPQSLDASPLPAQRSWSVRSLMVMGLVLLVGVILTVQYLSRPTLSTQDSALRTREAQLPLPDKPSIIVLPFTNLSGDPGQDYFSDGLTEVLTGNLSKISNLFVIARNSAFTYKGKAVQVQTVGREMGVRYVLESSVQRAGDMVRIAVQLIDATTGYHLWSQQYDRPLKDIFALQDEIVQKIVTTLKLQLSVREQGFLVRKTTDNLEAYDTYLRGLAYFLRFTKEANAQARQMYEHAVVLDPAYAEAYVMLGWTYGMEWIWQWSPDPRNVERAEELARQALALDDTHSGAHALLSWLHRRKHQPEHALAAAEQAVALAPNYDFAYIQLAESLIDLDRPAEAVRAAEQALRLNPRYPPDHLVHLGRAYYLIGRYEEAIAAQQHALVRNPNFLVAYTSLVVNYMDAWLAQQRQDPRTPEQALAAAQRAVALYDASSLAHVALGLAALLNKDYVQAEAEVERSLALNPVILDTYAVAAWILNWVGRPAEAIGMVEQALHLNSKPSSLYFLSLGHAYYLLGRTEEAIEPLQKVLSVYPHRIDTHVLLAAVYSKLGREVEARAEAAEVLRLNPKFSLEVHRQRMPSKDPATLDRHITALRKAGLK